MIEIIQSARKVGHILIDNIEKDTTILNFHTYVSSDNAVEPTRARRQVVEQN